MISRELQQGKAAEHLVVADLLLGGYQAFLADAGSPFDVVAVVGSILRTIQVRSTQQTRRTRRSSSQVYRFSLRRGKGGHQYSGEGIDIYAFVALNTRDTAYVSVKDLQAEPGKLIQIIEFHLAPSIRTYSNGTQRHYSVRDIRGFPFDKAVA